MKFTSIFYKSLISIHDIYAATTEFEIKLIHGRPYHPQSRGKCERSNRLLRQRISFACTKRSGFNWAEGLPIIAHEINTSVKKILGNVTPFQAYYGRVHYSWDEVSGKDDIRKRSKLAQKRARTNTLKNAHQPSKYEINERVLIRYPLARSRVPTERHILQGVVLKVNRYVGRFLIMYRKPDTT